VAAKEQDSMLSIGELTLDSPATYQICIQGYLDQSWSDYVGDVSIRVQSQPNKPVVTVITGEFQDQAALAGALSHLYELGFPLLSVEVVTIGALR
jgi:hypothetical protein